MSNSDKSIENTQKNTKNNTILVGQHGSNTMEIGNLSTIDSMLNFADELFKVIKENKKTIADIDKEYRDFKMTYPVIYRLMLDSKEYNRNSFRKYLKYISEKNKRTGSYWKDERDFAQSQSIYMMDLFRNRKPKPTSKQIYKYRTTIEKTIEEEWKKTKNAIQELEKISPEEIYLKQIIKELEKLSKLPEHEVLKLQQPNWNAAFGVISPECV
jgi:hypothetical protein